MKEHDDTLADQVLGITPRIIGIVHQVQVVGANAVLAEGLAHLEHACSPYWANVC